MARSTRPQRNSTTMHMQCPRIVLSLHHWEKNRMRLLLLCIQRCTLRTRVMHGHSAGHGLFEFVLRDQAARLVA